MEHNQYNVELTSVELGKLWATYTGNTMAKCVLGFYLRHIDDEDIKKVLENALELCETIIDKIFDVYKQENIPVPIGFTEEDVNSDAPRLFSDRFYLHYLKYTCKAGMNIYSTAIPLIVRNDIRDFYIDILQATTKLVSQVNDLLMEKGYFVKPPIIPIPDKVELVKKQGYLNGFFGNIRPPHALEITHLYDDIENNVTSKALLIGFSQTAKFEEVQRFLLRGKDITTKHIESCAQHLHRDHLPSPPLLDDVVTTSTYAPFSDKLMIWHKIDMFSMKIRAYANALSLNGRKDLGAMYAKFLADIGLFVEDGANIMIDHGWMEKVPQAVDREKLKNE
ncbi:DUF3231 family protein [Bacillus tuaregi]|uniref:DUF3231 family protein n=1 Tax=Bacillus tuaregi TaxID=1816695 RepID=UPI0008F886C4|nr:DUF3231 family protein [Bacillus tuaregi]